LFFSNEIIQRRLQREEQDRAYQAAVEQDRLKQEEEKRKIELARQEAEAREQKSKDKAALILRIATDRKRLKDSLPIEPTEKSETCTVRFRFPDGSQAQRKFRKQDKVQVLYEFIHCINCDGDSGAEPVTPKTPATPSSFINSKWQPHKCSDVHNYELTLSYPKMTLDRAKTLEESQCYPQATVFVREENEHLEEETLQE